MFFLPLNSLLARDVGVTQDLEGRRGEGEEAEGRGRGRRGEVYNNWSLVGRKGRRWNKGQSTEG